jgi:anti-anti-sigma regulatory factor
VHLPIVVSCLIRKTTGASTTLIQIHGRLTAEEVAELEAACLAADGTLFLDVMNLQFADKEGLNAIRKLASEGAQVVGASPYIRLLLDIAVAV